MDTSTPDNHTWDAEVRGTIIRKHEKMAGHVCNDNNVDAMYIDTRRVEDDIPWHETGEIMTKNTPTFGSLCINKNNAVINKVIFNTFHTLVLILDSRCRFFT